LDCISHDFKPSTGKTHSGAEFWQEFDTKKKWRRQGAVVIGDFISSRTITAG
jgi:hypothetical protein